MIYLASPYSHPDVAICEQRFHAVCRATFELIREGHVVFSPIVHGHPLVGLGLPVDWSFWERIGREHIQCSDEVAVLMLPRWDISAGVQGEIRFAEELGIPVRYLAQGATGSPTLARVAEERER